MACATPLLLGSISDGPLPIFWVWICARILHTSARRLSRYSQVDLSHILSLLLCPRAMADDFLIYRARKKSRVSPSGYYLSATKARIVSVVSLSLFLRRRARGLFSAFSSSQHRYGLQKIPGPVPLTLFLFLQTSLISYGHFSYEEIVRWSVCCCNLAHPSW